jgi:hypothetical protein
MSSAAVYALAPISARDVVTAKCSEFSGYGSYLLPTSVSTSVTTCVMRAFSTCGARQLLYPC